MKAVLYASAALALLSVAPPSQAVQITSLYTKLGGTGWKVDLKLVNDNASLISPRDPAGTISEFTVFFPYASYLNLTSLAAPVAWDPLAIQPDNSPSDGYLDYLINPGYSPLAIGGSASGYSIGFTYLGAGTPDPLRYTVVDPDTFATLYQGRTTNVVAAVPEPASGALLLLGLVPIARRRGGSSSRRARASGSVIRSEGIEAA